MFTSYRCTQDGTALEDVWAGAATTINGSIVLAGYTYGNWAGTEDIRLDEERDFAAMSMDGERLQLWSYQVKLSLMFRFLARGHFTNWCSVDVRNVPIV